MNNKTLNLYVKVIGESDFDDENISNVQKVDEFNFIAFNEKNYVTNLKDL